MVVVWYAETIGMEDRPASHSVKAARVKCVGRGACQKDATFGSFKTKMQPSFFFYGRMQAMQPSRAVQRFAGLPPVGNGLDRKLAWPLLQDGSRNVHGCCRRKIQLHIGTIADDNNMQPRKNLSTIGVQCNRC